MTWIKGAKFNAHLKKKKTTTTLVELKPSMSDHGVSLIYRNFNDRINRHRYEVAGNGFYRGKPPFSI